MSSVRNPEETKKKILDIAKELFIEKGYDNTSIQDIIDGLGGMTKGAIYHHFKSKQDILETLVESEVDIEYERVKKVEKGKNGLEKIKNILISSLNAHNIQSMIYSAQIVLKSPRMIGEQYLSTLNVVPEIEGYLLEGIEDGSITTEYPEEVAELILIYSNLSIGIHLMEFSKEKLIRKLNFIKEVFSQLGAPVFDDEVIKVAEELYDFLKKKNK